MGELSGPDGSPFFCKLCAISFDKWFENYGLSLFELHDSSGSVRGGAGGSMDPPEFGTFRDLVSETGDFVISVTLLWTPPE